ncbi:MAG: hypothetical protein MUO26_10810 [Methanotrichaceae archaeon]|nr:hypothetical protein [Methanotrichaceae archaeon]
MIRQRPLTCLFIIGAIILLIASMALAEQLTMLIGSKSNPNAHLFSYDQKFRESTYLHNYMMNMSASKEFTDASRLATGMALKANANFTEIMINANFIGIGRIDYLVLDPETGDKKEEMSRISHMFIGNFTMDEHIRVVRDHMNETGFLGPV